MREDGRLAPADADRARAGLQRPGDQPPERGLARPGRAHHRDRLPFTGPPVDLMAKLATAGGLVLTGGIVWWYGTLWPRSGRAPLEERLVRLSRPERR